jgi:flagellar protein FlaJ|tara:strand:- start:1204 stop:2037 length:834 start_codon:yes stop_codon:yes gene_type:complete
MEIKKAHWVGILLAIIIIILSLFLIGTKWFFFLIGMGILLGVSPFVFSTIRETKIENEKEEMFLEFARNLAENGKTGIPISKSIINMKTKHYGVLNEYIKKLASQIYLGIPLVTALKVFSKDVNNKTISRAITLIGQAEKSGGDIGQILESVAGAVSTSDKVKKERKAIISTLVIQGYIIFFIFMIIILVLQFKIIPMISGIDSLETGLAGTAKTTSDVSGSEISSSFFYLLLIQGFFSGLTIGKLAEKNFKAGIKHSFILVILGFLVSSGANFFLG